MGFEAQRRTSRIRFWIQHWVHQDLDPRLEANLRDILDSGSRKWHYFNPTSLSEQIEQAQRVLDELESFSRRLGSSLALPHSHTMSPLT